MQLGLQLKLSRLAQCLVFAWAEVCRIEQLKDLRRDCRKPESVGQKGMVDGVQMERSFRTRAKRQGRCQIVKRGRGHSLTVWGPETHMVDVWMCRCDSCSLMRLFTFMQSPKWPHTAISRIIRCTVAFEYEVALRVVPTFFWGGRPAGTKLS